MTKLRWLGKIAGLAVALMPALSPPAHSGLPEWLGGKREVSGLYRVSSEYQDEYTKKKTRLNGVGSLLVSGSKYFIVTTAHVSQGENLRIDLDGKSVRIKRRYADNRKDLEIIEIEDPGLVPTLVYAPKERVLGAYGEKLEEWIRAGVWPRGFKPYEHALLISPVSEPPTHVLIPAWLKRPKRENDAQVFGVGKTVISSDRRSPYFKTIYGEEIYSEAKFVPGMSGAPAFRGEILPGTPNAYYKVEGLAKRFKNFYRGSYLISADAIMDHLDAYESAQAEHSDATRWRYWNGISYRDYGDGTREINPGQSAAGSATSVEVGGGTSSDGGGGTSSDGGDGRGKAEQTDRDILLETDPWRRHALAPGVLWKGKPVMGFKVTHSGKSIYLPADALSINLAEEHKNRYEIEPLPHGTPIASLLTSRVPWLRSSEAKGILASSLTAVQGFSVHNPKIQLKNGRVRFIIPIEEGVLGSRKLVDELVFELDERGILVGSDDSEFRPVLSLQGKKSGKKYWLDLTQLFFDDLSELSEKSELFGPRVPTLELRREDQNFQFRVNFEKPLDYERTEAPFHERFGCTPSSDSAVPSSEALRLSQAVQELRLQ